MFLNVFECFLKVSSRKTSKPRKTFKQNLNVFECFLNVFECFLRFECFLASVIFDSDCSWIAFGPYKIL